MKRGSLFCGGWWSLVPLLLLPALLLLLVLFFKWDSIEKDVAANTRDSLSSAKVDWPNVETYHRGREVLITGTATDQASVDQALSIARNAEGVNTARFVGDIKAVPLVPPNLSIEIAGAKVRLAGTVANQATIDSLAEQANERYGADNVINKLKIGQHIEALPNINGIFSALNGAPSGTTINLLDRTLTLTGKVESDVSKATIGGNIARVFKGQVSNLLTVVEPVVERDACLDLVNDLLASGKINFQTSRANIKEDSYPLLESIADTARKCSNVRFEVAGHTDSVGSLELNNQLSKQRAQAVINHLTERGLEASQFEAAGYGPSQPVGDNATHEGRAENRRIEFKLIN